MSMLRSRTSLPEREAARGRARLHDPAGKSRQPARTRQHGFGLTLLVVALAMLAALSSPSKAEAQKPVHAATAGPDVLLLEAAAGRDSGEQSGSGTTIENSSPNAIPAGPPQAGARLRLAQQAECPEGWSGQPPVCCPPEARFVNGECVREAEQGEQRKCGRGRYLSNGHCCPRGTIWNGRRCLRNRGLQPQCPLGTLGIWPDCRPADTGQQCPTGTTGRFPNCTPIRTCPGGTFGTYPNCRSIQPQRCPTGFTGTPPSCQPTIRRCPPGTYGTPPVCRRTPVIQPSPRPVQPRSPSLIDRQRDRARTIGPLRPGNLGARPPLR